MNKGGGASGSNIEILVGNIGITKLTEVTGIMAGIDTGVTGIMAGIQTGIMTGEVKIVENCTTDNMAGKVGVARD